MQSKRALLAWIKNILQTEIKTIEELGKGFIYAQLLSVYDSSFQSKNININAKTEAEYLKNLKLCQDYFTKNNITVFFPIDKMCKCKVQDNLEFLQWLYKHLHIKDERQTNSQVNGSLSSGTENKSVGTGIRNRTGSKESSIINDLEPGNSRIVENRGKSTVIDSSKFIENGKILKITSNRSFHRIQKDKSTDNVTNNSDIRKCQNELLDLYESENTDCANCAENKKVAEKYKANEYYLDSKIKYYENKNLELTNKIEEIEMKEKALIDKENMLMRQAIINMDEANEIKQIKEKCSTLQDNLECCKEALEQCRQQNKELEYQLKEYDLHISKLESHEEKNREEFTSEIEKLKEYYETLISNKESEFNDSKVNYIRFIKGYERERDMYYVKLKEIEALLKEVEGDENLKSLLFQLLYKKE